MKNILTSLAALAVICVASPSWAGYDISGKNILEESEVPTLPSEDVLSTDYLHVYRTGDGTAAKIAIGDAWTNSLFAPVTLGASETINSSEVGKTLCFGSAAGTATLPAATGSGAVYKFTVCAVPPTTGYVITVTGDDTIDGQVMSTQDSGDTVVGWETASNTDTVTFTSSTKMGASIGGWIEVQDIAADQWTIKGQGVSTGSEASPFSGS